VLAIFPAAWRAVGWTGVLAVFRAGPLAGSCRPDRRFRALWRRRCTEDQLFARGPPYALPTIRRTWVALCSSGRTAVPGFPDILATGLERARDCTADAERNCRTPGSQGN